MPSSSYKAPSDSVKLLGGTIELKIRGLLARNIRPMQTYNGARLCKFPQEINVELTLERDDKLRQALDWDPLPGGKLRVFGSDIDIGVHS